ncbi:hypothetical protein ACIQV3_02495 [Streptomyces sp. NPDC099050]|uniref:hypothetical protein n=1 Tax=Streptomyces sp. NPDC099050 TaxID=3366100 RepID=UPI00380DC952
MRAGLGEERGGDGVDGKREGGEDEGGKDQGSKGEGGKRAVLTARTAVWIRRREGRTPAVRPARDPVGVPGRPDLSTAPEHRTRGGFPVPSRIDGDHDLRAAAGDAPYRRVEYTDELLTAGGVPVWILRLGGVLVIAAQAATLARLRLRLRLRLRRGRTAAVRGRPDGEAA